MSRLNKKEIENLANQYYWYSVQKKEYAERLQGLVMTLQIIGQLTNIKNAAFKMQNKRAEHQIKEVKRLVEKAIDNREFDITLLDDYYDDIAFYERLDDDEKSILQSCIDYILEYTNYNKFINIISQ